MRASRPATRALSLSKLVGEGYEDDAIPRVIRAPEVAGVEEHRNHEHGWCESLVAGCLPVDDVSGGCACSVRVDGEPSDRIFSECGVERYVGQGESAEQGCGRHHRM